MTSLLCNIQSCCTLLLWLCLFLDILLYSIPLAFLPFLCWFLYLSFDIILFLWPCTLQEHVLGHLLNFLNDLTSPGSSTWLVLGWTPTVSWGYKSTPISWATDSNAWLPTVHLHQMSPGKFSTPTLNLPHFLPSSPNLFFPLYSSFAGMNHLSPSPPKQKCRINSWLL